MAPYAPASMWTSSLLERGGSLRPVRDRAEARRAERPARHEVGARAAQELFDAPALRPQDLLHSVLDFGGGFEPRNRIGFRVIADVLHLELTRQTLAHELQVGLVRQLDGAAVEEDDLASLHRILDLTGAGANEALELITVHWVTLEC
jgi:hypothetical protein